DAFALLRLVLEQREDEIVLAHPVRAVDLVGVGDVDKLGDWFGLEVGKVHRWMGSGKPERPRRLSPAAKINQGVWRLRTDHGAAGGAPRSAMPRGERFNASRA